MNRLNLTPGCFQEFCEALRSQCALRSANVADHLCSVVSDILTDSWFVIDNNPISSSINRSTEQGDPLADMLVNLFMIKVLNSILSFLADAGFGVPHTPVTTNLLGEHSPRHLDRYVLC